MNWFYSVVLILLSFSLNAQSFGIEIPVGYSSYSMKDLNRFLHEQEDSNPPVKITNDFPANIHFGFRLYRQDDLLQEGIEYTHNITGGRLHYKDYSGEIGIDITAISHGFGLFVKSSLIGHKEFQLKASLSIGAYLSTVEFNQYKVIGIKEENFKLNTVSLSVALSPGIEPVYYFSKYVYVGLRAAILINSSGGLHEEGNRKAKLYDSHDKQVTTQWSGLRGDFYIGFKFPELSVR